MCTGFDALGDVLKPGSVAGGGGSVTGGPNQATHLTGGGGGMGQQQQSTAQSSGKVLTGDLDSSLASLAENLTINKSASAQVK